MVLDMHIFKGVRHTVDVLMENVKSLIGDVMCRFVHHVD